MATDNNDSIDYNGTIIQDPQRSTTSRNQNDAESEIATNERGMESARSAGIPRSLFNANARSSRIPPTFRASAFGRPPTCPVIISDSEMSDWEDSEEGSREDSPRPEFTLSPHISSLLENDSDSDFDSIATTTMSESSPADTIVSYDWNYSLSPCNWNYDFESDDNVRIVISEDDPDSTSSEESDILWSN